MGPGIEKENNGIGGGLKAEQLPAMSEYEAKQAALINSIKAFIDEKSDEFKKYVDSRLDELENNNDNTQQ